MARSTLDETLIRAAARVTDWHAAHRGAAAEPAVARPPNPSGAMPSCAVHLRERRHAEGAEPLPMQGLPAAG